MYHITTVTCDRRPQFAFLYKGRRVVCQLRKLDAESRSETLCYMLVPDHLHRLVGLRSGNLPDLVRLLKGRTAHGFGESLWQPTL